MCVRACAHVGGGGGGGWGVHLIYFFSEKRKGRKWRESQALSENSHFLQAPPQRLAMLRLSPGRGTFKRKAEPSVCERVPRPLPSYAAREMRINWG